MKWPKVLSYESRMWAFIRMAKKLPLYRGGTIDYSKFLTFTFICLFLYFRVEGNPMLLAPPQKLFHVPYCLDSNPKLVAHSSMCELWICSFLTNHCSCNIFPLFSPLLFGSCIVIIFFWYLSSRLKSSQGLRLSGSLTVLGPRGMLTKSSGYHSFCSILLSLPWEDHIYS